MSRKSFYFLVEVCTKSEAIKSGRQKQRPKDFFTTREVEAFRQKFPQVYIVITLTSNPENIWCVRHVTFMAGVSYSKLRSIRITNVKFFMEPVHYSTENVIHHTRTRPLLFTPPANHASFDVTNGTGSPRIVTKLSDLSNGADSDRVVFFRTASDCLDWRKRDWQFVCMFTGCNLNRRTPRRSWFWLVRKST